MGIRRQVRPAPADRWGPLPPRAGARASRARPALRVLERILLAIGIACLGYYGYVSAEAALYQAVENRELDELLRRGASPAAPPSTASSAPRPRAVDRRGTTVGRIEIPRLGVSAVIKAGTDARTLQLAVGHIPGTAAPGEAGNTGLAGHRDTFFRRLRNIRGDDEIRVTTPQGTYEYRVERTVVVDPDDVWVLDPTPEAALTLVTCYPFSYVGAAPQRFIVRARLVSPSGQPAFEAQR